MIGAEPYPPPALPHRVASSHVELYWKCDQGQSGQMQVEGMARNPWSPQEVRFLELDLVGVDRDGRAVSGAHAEVPNTLLHMNQTTRFQLTLRATGQEARYDLYYQYWFQDVEFNALLAGPPMGPPRLLAYVNRFMILDACSPTRHLAR
jgi:hypothetical protein